MNRWTTHLFAFLAVSGAQAQTFIGNRAGIGSYTLEYRSDPELPTDLTEDLTALIAPTITLPVEVRLSKYFALIAEPGFVQRGIRSENDQGTVVQRVNNLELALLGKGNMTFGLFEPYLIAGPSITRPISLRVSQEYTLGTTPQTDDQTVTTDDISSFEKSYWCLYAGIGIARRFGAARLFLDYRAMWGLTPVQRTEFTDVNGNVIQELEIFDRGHIISIGWSIPLSREAWRATPAPPAEEPPEH